MISPDLFVTATGKPITTVSQVTWKLRELADEMDAQVTDAIRANDYVQVARLRARAEALRDAACIAGCAK